MKFLVITFSLCILSGCAALIPAQPDDPFYAPRIPQTAAVPEAVHGSLYNGRNATYLFADRNAHQVGDLITVRLIEKTNAQKTSATDFKKTSAVETDAETIFDRVPNIGNHNIFKNKISGSRDFAGESDSNQSNSLSGTITVSVVDVLPNGNLIIRGEKWLTLNKGDEYIRIAGIVRPEDLDANNTVDSTKLGDARISYSGRGVLADANEPGILMRFFNSVLFPF